MIEYLLFYKQRLPISSKWERSWDIFITAYNSSGRVRSIYERVSAKKKYWLILPEYEYTEKEYPPSGSIYADQAESEVVFISQFVESLGPSLKNKRVVIDITGFISHYVLVLIAILGRSGVTRCDVIYGEPVRYLRSERTRFSDEAVLAVRQVSGFEGTHTTDTDHDLLVLAVGYDFRLVAEVANNKEHARKVQLFGLPSLRPDMYQENLLCAEIVAEAVGPEASSPHRFTYAPAHDPFVTASVLSDLVRDHRARHPRANVYLSPLSTKAQALGFAVFYLRECKNTPTSILYPFCRRYMKETSEGLSGAWLYRIELDQLTLKSKR